MLCKLQSVDACVLVYYYTPQVHYSKPFGQSVNNERKLKGHESCV